MLAKYSETPPVTLLEGHLAIPVALAQSQIISDCEKNRMLVSLARSLLLPSDLGDRNSVMCEFAKILNCLCISGHVVISTASKDNCN